MSQYVRNLDKLETRTPQVFTTLLTLMPLPPPAKTDKEAADAAEESAQTLLFSHVEALMYVFHTLATRHPAVLAEESAAERLKDFRIRLQYFARGVQVYIKQLKLALQGKSGEALKSEENKMKVAALKVTSNIQTLIRDLFHNPPSYKASISLSWLKPAAKAPATTASPGQKRTQSGGGDAEVKKAARSGTKGQRVYAPPSGKFSEKAGTYSDSGTGGGYRNGRGGGGGYRGRGW